MTLKDLRDVIHEDIHLIGLNWDRSAEDYEESRDFGLVSMYSNQVDSVIEQEVVEITTEGNKIIVYVDYPWYM